jgi:hypothetical protein
MQKFKNITTITLGFICGIVFTATCTVSTDTALDTALSLVDTATSTSITATTATAGTVTNKSRAVVQVQVEHDYSNFDYTTQTLTYEEYPAENRCFDIIEKDGQNGWIDFSGCCPAGFSVVSVSAHYNGNNTGDAEPGGNVLCLEDI